MLALESAGVRKSYLDAPVLRGLSFAVEEGESFGFAGVNGAGKSTFLKCMLNFCHYESGDISIFGVSSKKRQSRAPISFLPERFTPPYYLTGEEFLRMMLRLQSLPYSRDEALAMIDSLDLAREALAKPARAYSKGMTQKLGLAACLLTRKKLYILDEPMSGLDPKARALVKRQFTRLRESGATIFFTSHMLADIDEICSQMAVLHDGVVRFTGSPAEMRAAHPANSLEEAYLRVIDTPPADA